MSPIRVVGLGNDLLADDGVGLEVVRRLRQRLPDTVEIATSIASGFALLDELMGADRLVVVDTVAGHPDAAGTVQRFAEGDVASTPGTAPHYVGLFETLRLGRELGLRMPSEVVIFGVQAADSLTIGGTMSPKVQAAIPSVMEMVERQVAEWTGKKDQRLRG